MRTAARGGDLPDSPLINLNRKFVKMRVPASNQSTERINARFSYGINSEQLSEIRAKEQEIKRAELRDSQNFGRMTLDKNGHAMLFGFGVR